MVDTSERYKFTCKNCGCTWTDNYLSIRHSERFGYYDFCECGERAIDPEITHVVRKKRSFTPNEHNCPVEINPCGETEKSWIVYDGSNGLVGRNSKAFYKYIAKSICYTDPNGKVFAPVWG